MEITVPKEDLLRQAGLAAGIVSRKPTIAVLGSVLVRANGSGGAEFASTDLDLTVRSDCAVTVARQGVVAIPAVKLYELVRSFPDAPVRIAATAAGVSVDAGGFRGRLQTQAADDFPQLPEADAALAPLVPAARLRDLIVRTRFAVSQDEKRYQLAGALMTADDKALTLVTTDSRRLALASAPRAGAPIDPVLVPKKALDALATLLDGADGDVAFGRNGNHLFFEVGGQSLIARRIEGEFPAYQRILPKSFRSTATVDRAAFLDVLRRVMIVAEAESRRVALTLEPDAVAIAAQSADVGESDERVAATYAGESVAAKVNGTYVAEFLDAAATEKVTFSMNDAVTAMGFEAVGGDVAYRYVCMPQVA